MKKLAKVGIIAVIIMVPVILGLALMFSSQSYTTVSDVRTGGYEGREVSVQGTVVNGSINVVGNQLVFNITDGSKVLTVHYAGSMNLSKQDEVVVNGIYSSATGIDAQQILTGCASAYVGPQSSIFQDPVVLGSSILIVVFFTALFLVELIRKRRV